MSLAFEKVPTRPDRTVRERRHPHSVSRVRLDGKFFSRGDERIRLNGVTYGPFCPHESDCHFPSQKIVRADFQSMVSIGINSIRTYHAPPQ